MAVALVVFCSGGEMLGSGLTQRLRLIKEDDRAERTFCQLKQRACAGFAGGAKVRWCFPGGFVQVCLVGCGDRPFRQRQERGANNGGDRPLGARVKFANGFDGVAKQLNADGASRFRRENIDDATAHGELARQLYHFRSRVTHRTQMRNQFYVRNLGVFCQGAREIEVGCRILIAPEGSSNGGDYERDLPVGDAKEGGGAAFENVRVRALRLPGQPVKGRKCGDAARGSWKDAAEETQRFREGFGAAIGVRDKKCRTPQRVRQIGGNKGLRDIVQAGD